MRTIVPEIPASIDAAVLRCLASAPDDRFASAQELGAALRDDADAEDPFVALTPPSFSRTSVTRIFAAHR